VVGEVTRCRSVKTSSSFLLAFMEPFARGPPARPPGHDYSYTNTWPAESLVGNAPTGDLMIWSVLSLIVLIGGTGVMFAIYGRWSQKIGWESLEAPALWRFRPTVVHGDLAEENVLVAGGTVVAVRGWSQAHVGDPAEDLAWVDSSAPVDCLDSIEDAYDIARSEGVDRHLRERAELVSELSLARWLLHGVRTGDKPVINDAVAMLEDLAAQVGDAPLVEPAPPRRRTDSSESVSSSTTLRSSASASSASAGRSCGSRRVMVATSSSTSAGMSGTSLEGRGTSSWTLRKAI